MSKLSVAEAAERFKVSKEAIHNRIRRGSLDCIIEHGTKYVLIDEPIAESVKVSKPQNDKYYNYIEEQNTELKEKVNLLEKQNIQLRDQKELMLLEEKRKIEQIYKERDEQLKHVLNTVTQKFLPQIRQEENNEVNKEVEDYVDVEEFHSEPIRLKSFLKLKNYKSAKKERIKNRFKKLLGQDDRVFRQDGKIYIDPTRFNYMDLLE